MAKLGKPAVAILIMGAIIAVLMTLCTPRSTSTRSGITRGNWDGKLGSDTNHVEDSVPS
jgi:hypothetical protein